MITAQSWIQTSVNILSEQTRIVYASLNTLNYY